MVKYVQKVQIKDPDKTASLGESDQESMGASGYALKCMQI